MARDLDRPQWKGQRPWLELWHAVVLDESRRRALWIRQTLFVPRQGDARATIWGAWFDADRTPVAAKRYAPFDGRGLPAAGSAAGGQRGSIDGRGLPAAGSAAGGQRGSIDGRGLPAAGSAAGAELANTSEDDTLIRIDDSRLGRAGAAGQVDGLAWDVRWTGGRAVHEDLTSWLPAPTHGRPVVHDAEATGRVVVGGEAIEIRGRATAMHLWGKRRMPTLHWIYAPWLEGGSLEVQAMSLRDRFAMGIATLRLDGPAPMSGSPATAAHASCLVTSTVAGARRLIHARAWAEPRQMVGYAYRDTDDRDLMIAQSDIGSAQLEVYHRAAPGAPWHPVEERRVEGGVAVEIHQRTPLPEVDYLAWDDTARPRPAVVAEAPRADQIAWPEVGEVVALGLTYGDHARETGQKVDRSAPPPSFRKHARALVPGAATVHVPSSAELLAALEAIEPGLSEQLTARMPVVPAVMDYEGEIAVVALGAIDPAALARGEPQPLGLAAANDLTSRLCQALGDQLPRERSLDYWTVAKSFAGFLPVAPRVWAPAGGLAALPELPLQTRVNGELRQDASTKIMLYTLPQMIAAAAAHLGRPLARGDVILTGTPSGVGMRMSVIGRKVAALIKDRIRRVELLVSTFATSTALLRPGDVVEVDAGPAGTIRTRLGA